MCIRDSLLLAGARPLHAQRPAALLTGSGTCADAYGAHEFEYPCAQQGNGCVPHDAYAQQQAQQCSAAAACQAASVVSAQQLPQQPHSSPQTAPPAPGAGGWDALAGQPPQRLGANVTPPLGRRHFAAELMRLGFCERASVDAMLDLEVEPTHFSERDVERAVRWITAKEAAEASLVKLTEDLDDDY